MTLDKLKDLAVDAAIQAGNFLNQSKLEEWHQLVKNTAYGTKTEEVKLKNTIRKKSFGYIAITIPNHTKIILLEINNCIPIRFF